MGLHQKRNKTDCLLKGNRNRGGVRERLAVETAGNVNVILIIIWARLVYKGIS